MAAQDPLGDDLSASIPMVIRPSWRSYRNYLAVRRGYLLRAAAFWLTTVAGALAFGRGSRSLSLLLLAIIGMTTVGVVLYMLYYMLGRKIVVTSDEIRVCHLFNPPAVVPIAQIDRIVICTLTYSENLNQRAVFALDGRGRCVLSLYLATWDWTELDAVWMRRTIPVTGSWDERVGYQEVEARFPS